MAVSRKTKSLAAVMGVSAAAALVAFTSAREGVSLTPYSDRLANGLATVCYGETNVQMRRYTLPECKQMLGDSLAGYADKVRSLTPGFDSLTDGQKVAVVDFAYNAGVANYERSTLRKMYAAKEFPAACDQFLKWRFVAGGTRDCSDPANKCSGIAERRRAARAVCRGETP